MYISASNRRQVGQIKGKGSGVCKTTHVRLTRLNPLTEVTQRCVSLNHAPSPRVAQLRAPPHLTPSRLLPTLHRDTEQQDFALLITHTRWPNSDFISFPQSGLPAFRDGVEFSAYQTEEEKSCTVTRVSLSED